VGERERLSVERRSVWEAAEPRRESGDATPLRLEPRTRQHDLKRVRRPLVMNPRERESVCVCVCVCVIHSTRTLR